MSKLLLTFTLPRQKRHVGPRDVDDRLVERVTGQVAAVENAAAFQVEAVPGEGGVGGDQVPGGAVDHDLGGVAAAGRA